MIQAYERAGQPHRYVCNVKTQRAPRHCGHMRRRVVEIRKAGTDGSSDGLFVSSGGRPQYGTRRQQAQVLIIANAPARLSLLEQTFMRQGVQTVTAATITAAEAVRVQMGLDGFGLVVVNIADLECCAWRNKRLACHLLRDWTETHPTLPFLFIGTVPQRRAILAIRADTVRFLTQPLKRDDLIGIVQTLCSQKKRHLSSSALLAVSGGRGAHVTLDHGDSDGHVIRHMTKVAGNSDIPYQRSPLQLSTLPDVVLDEEIVELGRLEPKVRRKFWRVDELG